MIQKIRHIKSLWHNNSKVAENYFFMTLLQVAVVLINLLLYPYLIRTLGKENYGTYIFILSNVQIVVLFFASGFSMPALKKISLNVNNLSVKSQTISEIFTAKFILFSFCTLLFVVCLLFIPFVSEHRLLYLIILLMSFGDMLFPLWYFQGMQQMKFVTYVNLGGRLLSVPLILIFVKSPNDLLTFTVIMSGLPFCGCLFVFFYLILKEKISFRFVSLSKLKPVFRDAMPFYWTTAFGQLKGEGLKFIVGIFWGMNNVAVYDLANKIINLASIFTSSINTVIFPKAINQLNKEKVKRIFRYEIYIGLLVIILLITLGYWAVLLLGGKDMIGAYPLVVVMSFTILTSLLVTCYVNYLFVPQNHYYFVTKNQLVSLISFVLAAVVGLILYKHIIVLVAALTLSQIIEVLYCNYLQKKHRLLDSVSYFTARHSQA